MPAAVAWRVSHSNDSCVVDIAGGGRYEARICIATASLGMLKNGRIAFEPELPLYKQQAIEDTVRPPPFSTLVHRLLQLTAPCAPAASGTFEKNLAPQFLPHNLADTQGFGVLNKTVLVFEQPFWAPADFITREMPDLSGRW